LKTILPERLVYVAECGMAHFLYREFAYAPRGQRIIAKTSAKIRNFFSAGLKYGRFGADICTVLKQRPGGNKVLL